MLDRSNGAPPRLFDVYLAIANPIFAVRSLGTHVGTLCVGATQMSRRKRRQHPFFGVFCGSGEQRRELAHVHKGRHAFSTIWDPDRVRQLLRADESVTIGLFRNGHRLLEHELLLFHVFAAYTLTFGWQFQQRLQ